MPAPIQNQRGSRPRAIPNAPTAAAIARTASFGITQRSNPPGSTAMTETSTSHTAIRAARDGMTTGRLTLGLRCAMEFRSTRVCLGWARVGCAHPRLSNVVRC